MAYVLGLIFADGAIEDVRKSSRTCYLAISNNDKSLLEQVRNALHSEHKIYYRKPRIVKFSDGKSYRCAESFILRIGNKGIYKNLLSLGLVPRKSLIVQFPEIPDAYFNYFVRGYFDGDGCLMVNIPKGQKAERITVIFTSGSKVFLDDLSTKLHFLIDTNYKRLYKNGGAYQLSYRKMDSLKILHFMYDHLNQAPYLERKYNLFRNIKSL